MIVMELMENGNLKDYLHSTENISWTTKLEMALQIALGIQYLHNNNVLFIYELFY